MIKTQMFLTTPSATPLISLITKGTKPLLALWALLIKTLILLVPLVV